MHIEAVCFSKIELCLPPHPCSRCPLLRAFFTPPPQPSAEVMGRGGGDPEGPVDAGAAGLAGASHWRQRRPVFLPPPLHCVMSTGPWNASHARGTGGFSTVAHAIMQDILQGALQRHQGDRGAHDSWGGGCSCGKARSSGQWARSSAGVHRGSQLPKAGPREGHLTSVAQSFRRAGSQRGADEGVRLRWTPALTHRPLPKSCQDHKRRLLVKSMAHAPTKG